MGLCLDRFSYSREVEKMRERRREEKWRMEMEADGVKKRSGD
jgi:hypothetical protein